MCTWKLVMLKIPPLLLARCTCLLVHALLTAAVAAPGVMCLWQPAMGHQRWAVHRLSLAVLQQQVRVVL
jgi:hypothetical protein